MFDIVPIESNGKRQTEISSRDRDFHAYLSFGFGRGMKIVNQDFGVLVGSGVVQ